MKAIRRNTAFSIFIMFIALLTLSSCKNRSKAIAFTGPGTVSNITEHMEKNMLSYEWFTAKIATEVDLNEEHHSFKINLRIRKDSLIWLSISPALGIEVARILISPDSMRFLDKWNDQYFIGDYAYLESKLGLGLDFRMLQEMIVGDPLLYDPDDRFKSKKDKDGFVLTTKARPKVRRAAGMKLTKKDAEQMEDTLIMDIDEKRYDRMIEKHDDEEALILKRYWVSADNSKVVRTIVSDLIKLRSLEADYSKFEEVQDQLLPSKIQYDISDQQQDATFKLEYSRIRLDKPVDFPFTIPEKFVRIL